MFVLAGGVAGLAGSLLIAQQRLVTPADLGFTTASFALLAVVIGGAGSLWGACLGAALVVLIRDALGPSLDGHGTAGARPGLRAGGLPAPARCGRAAAAAAAAGPGMTVLRCAGVSRSFGALKAVRRRRPRGRRRAPGTR